MNGEPKNPRAFPLPDNKFLQSGMTLRDYFAGQTLAGLMSELGKMPPSEMFDAMNSLAKWSYVAADAMLKEREKSL